MSQNNIACNANITKRIVDESDIVFSGNPLDTCHIERAKEGWVEEQMRKETSLFLPMHQLKPLVSLRNDSSSLELSWTKYEGAIKDAIENKDALVILLGTRDGVAHFAVDITAYDPQVFTQGAKEEEEEEKASLKFINLINACTQMKHEEASIAAQARHILNWHRINRFCSMCGTKSKIVQGGHKRRCTNTECEQKEIYPRTDPVAIMLVVRGDYCLLGRQDRYPKGMLSCLAGFMEAGESIEEAVRRETKEETGVSVGRVHYVASQPWPFPCNLMIGLIAEGISEHIDTDKDELDHAAWYHRDQVKEMIARSADPNSTEPRLPPAYAIAHQLARYWVNNECFSFDSKL